MPSPGRREDGGTGCGASPMRAKGPKRPDHSLESLARSERGVTVYAPPPAPVEATA
jgi:hypothetical protein